MNIDKILEGLNCCSSLDCFRACESCPYSEEPCCLDKLLGEAEAALLKTEAKNSDHV